MTANVIIFVLFLVLCGLYLWLVRNKKDTVYATFAGSSDEPHGGCCQCRLYTEESKVIKLPDGSYRNTASFHRIKISGNCMSPVNIHSDEEWLAEKMKADEVRGKVKTGDVLLIHLADSGKYKIRRLKNILPDGMLNTYYYDDNGDERFSSRPHSQETVMGVVRYRLH